ANFLVHARLVVAGNLAETARNILAHQPLFRAGIACGLVYCGGLMVMATALFVVLEPVHRGLALLAAVARPAYALVWLVMTPNLAYPLRLLRAPDFLRAFDAGQLQALPQL